MFFGLYFILSFFASFFLIWKSIEGLKNYKEWAFSIYMCLTTGWYLWVIFLIGMFKPETFDTLFALHINPVKVVLALQVIGFVGLCIGYSWFL